MAAGKVDATAWARMVKAVKRFERQPRNLVGERRRRQIPGRGGGSASSSSSPCECGACTAGGLITACSATGDATTVFSFTPGSAAERAAFGSTVLVVHVSGCTWESDEFPGVDLGDGSHDYFYKMVFVGTGHEEAELTLEDET